jgi:hypothetical protein
MLIEGLAVVLLQPARNANAAMQVDAASRLGM